MPLSKTNAVKLNNLKIPVKNSKTFCGGSCAEGTNCVVAGIVKALTFKV